MVIEASANRDALVTEELEMFRGWAEWRRQLLTIKLYRKGRSPLED